MSKHSVLFVCTHNSARSQMAEGLLRARHGDRFDVYSAGTKPSTVNPFAVQAMRELGIDISGHHSESIDAFVDRTIDYVVTVCDSAREECPYFPARLKNMHHSFVDPSAATGTKEEQLAVFRQVRDEIEAWLEKTFAASQKKVS